MKKFLQYLKNRGFTLVEALVVTIIAGYCILPVIGTMQGGLTQTARFDHQEKLRTLARSRLNKELAAGAFDHNAIDTTTWYHYMYYDQSNPPVLLSTDATATPDIFVPYTGYASPSLLFTYKVSVAIKENLNIATTSFNIDKKLLEKLPGLKALTVLAELEDGPNVIETASLSYFAMLNIPSFSDDYIWIANAKNVEIIGVDPDSKSAVQNFLLPLANAAKKRDDSANDVVRPWHMAVHPSKKFIAYQRRNSIWAININKEDAANFGAVKQLAPTTGNYSFNLVESAAADKEKSSKDFGLAFRPDGKFCFVSAHSNKNLYALKVANQDNWSTLTLTNIATISTLLTDQFSCLHTGNDGWLYLGLKDKKQAVRFPMYAPDYASLSPQTIADGIVVGNLMSIQTSTDGKNVYILWAKDGGNNPYLACFSSQNLQKLGAWRMTFKGDSSDMKLSNDSRYLAVVDEFDAKTATTNEGGLYLVNLKTSPLNGLATFTVAPPTPFSAARATIGTSKKNRDRNDILIFDPVTTEFFFDDKEKPLLFGVDSVGVLSGSYTTSIPDNRIVEYAPVEKSIVSMTTRKPEYVMVGTADSKVEYVDIYTGKQKEEKQITVRDVPSTIGIFPDGESFKVGYGSSAIGLDTFDAIYGTTISTIQGSGNSKAVAYSIDKNVGDFFASLEISAQNGYWIPQAPIPSGLPNDRCRDVDLANTWVPKDMVPLNRGGFLMLFARSDGSTMLDWIGKHQWGTDAGKYERFARWFSSTNLSQGIGDLAASTGNLDSAAGTITLAKFASNPIGGKVTRVKFNTTFSSVNGGLSANGKYLTPVLVEISGSTLTIRDIGSTVAINSPTTSYDQAITWSVDGVIKANYYIGWWSGQGGTSNAGVVKWGVDAAGLFISDYYPATTCTVGLGVNDSAGSRRKYEIEFTVEQSTMSFPPAKAQNIAVSADDRFLAIETNEDPSPNKIHLYDFAANNYGHLTQLSGLVADYRNDGTDVLSAVKTGVSFTGPASLSMGITSNDVYRSHKSYPGNYFYSTGSVAGPLNDRRDASKRFFGYYIPAANYSNLAIAHRDPIRLWVGGSQWSSLSLLGTSDLTVDTSFVVNYTQKQDSINQIQLNHTTNTGDRFSALFAANSATDGALSKITTDPIFDNHFIEMAGWAKIESSSTRPFLFNPVFLKSYSLAGCVNDTVSELTWSRDRANPILFFLDSMNDDFWALKPGRLFTRIANGLSFNMADSQMVVSADGQRLMIANEDSKEVYINDIANPLDSFFDGVTKTQSAQTGFGRLAQVATMTAVPKVLATLPFNSYKSTTGSGTFECVATLSFNISGLHTAALASGGIYILGGSAHEDDAPTDKIFVFNPASYPGTIITPIATVLKKPIKMQSIAAYDNEIYLFNGRDAAAHTDWVQKYNPTTGVIRSSLDFPLIKKTITFTSPSEAGLTWTQGTHKVSCNAWSYYESDLRGWLAFDGDVDDNSNPFNHDWAWEHTPPYPAWLTYEFPTSEVITQIRYWPEVEFDNRVQAFEFLGSHNGLFPNNGGTLNTDYWLVHTETSCANASTMQTYNFTNSTGYKYYQFRMTDSHGSDWIVVGELEYWGPNIPASQIQLTRTMNDTRGTVKLQEGAACMTPYGIVLVGGTSDSINGTTTATIYWPHGIDSYTDSTNHSLGISRSIKPLPSKIVENCLVWHKGKLYRIGGRTTISPTITPLNIDIFDFDTNSWTTVAHNNLAYFESGILGANYQRYKAAACSFGDEIFIFGGCNSAGTLQSSVVAWNPETTKVRVMANLPAAAYAKCAVPCGSSIYLIGGATSSSAGGTASIWKFTP